MPSSAVKIAQTELEFLGDILSAGILRKGLAKVGTDVDRATARDVEKAVDEHIERAMTSFVGPREARQRAIRLKQRLAQLEAVK